jgi:hypothetical protein
MGFFLFATASESAMGPTQRPIQWVPRVLSLGLKRPEREAEHSPPSSADVKVRGAILPLPQYVFMVWYLFKHKDNLDFYLYDYPYKSAISSSYRLP